MSNHETFFNEILELTRLGRLPWQQIGRKDNADVILNQHLVIRQFSATYHRRGETFTLLLLERRHLYSEQGLFTEREERRRSELLVLEGGELIINFNEVSIKLARMMELLDLAIFQSDRVRHVLGAPT